LVTASAKTARLIIAPRPRASLSSRVRGRRRRARRGLFRQAATPPTTAGTNATSALLVPGATLHDELDLLVAAGFTNAEALGAATRTAAELLHADSLGRIAPGAVADLVVLNSSPLDDIAATRDIAWVMIRGYIVSPDSLRRTWRK
jgi:imidazolonepropionase-like amidohydrolase